MKSFVNKQTRVIQHDGSIVKENDLDSRWDEAASIAVDEVIFLSRHTAVSNRPALTVHPIGMLKDPNFRSGFFSFLYKGQCFLLI